MQRLTTSIGSLSLVLFFLFGSSVCYSDARLPGVFGDHMVLQQQMPIKVWGWADPGENVTVEVGGGSASAQADGSGKWKVELPALPASNQPITLKVSANNVIELKDVLVGEVWLCSGQSNMEWSVRQSANAAEEIQAANYPLIRHIKISKKPSNVPLEDIGAPWQTCSPDTVASFTAAGYFMARRLHQELKVPVGLINSSWGGTRVEPWTPPVGFQNVPAVNSIYDDLMLRTPGSDSHKARLTQHIQATEAWLVTAREGLAKGGAVPPSPAYPAGLQPYTSHQSPAMLYNGMIHAIVGFPLRGAIWYQGESNHVEGMLYFQKKKSLINGWRSIWGIGEFPFYFVQIAPYRYGKEDPGILASFWEAQQAVTSLPNTGMVVTNDIATLNDIHPPNKQDVGIRLANLALRNTYGRDEIVAESPVLDGFHVDGNRLVVKFRGTAGGLKTRDGEAPTHFELIGPGSGGFHPAETAVSGDEVTLTSAAVSKPTAFRFAWHKLSQPNLMGGTGLPVGTCRGGKIPDFLSNIPTLSEYQLVYELDLSKLAGEIKYDVDNRGEMANAKFDRIGYLLELESSELGKQGVFVSMNAFTEDLGQIGIPSFSAKSVFQEKVQGLEVYSNVKGLRTGKLDSGNIEFWPNNYGPNNVAGVANASQKTYDFGDQKVDPVNGYGCMQVHNFQDKQTIFAINHWKQGANADIGIGNQKQGDPDWTFAANGKRYTSKRLKVLVLPAAK